MANYKVATSGHRKPETSKMRNKVIEFVKYLKMNNYSLIVGDAEGWDATVTIQAIKQKVEYELHAAFDSNARRLPYGFVVKAKRVFYYKDKYEGPQDNKVFQQRNKAMVDRSRELHVYNDGRAYGGTINTIKYARSIHTPITNWYKGVFEGYI